MENLDYCILAGGCFWCIAMPYYDCNGVKQVISGYAGGTEVNPTYEEVKAQKTHHLESIKIIYDTTILSYHDILSIYFDAIDPFDEGGQFIDRGESYTTAVFIKNEEMKKEASSFIKDIERKTLKKVHVKILDESTFYVAEEYHQDYCLKNPEEMEKELILSGRKK